jgi:hypothetical protein
VSHYSTLAPQVSKRRRSPVKTSHRATMAFRANAWSASSGWSETYSDSLKSVDSLNRARANVPADV